MKEKRKQEESRLFENDKYIEWKNHGYELFLEQFFFYRLFSHLIHFHSHYEPEYLVSHPTWE